MRIVESLLVVKDKNRKYYIDGKRATKQRFEEMQMFAIAWFNSSTIIKNGATYYRETLKIHSEEQNN